MPASLPKISKKFALLGNMLFASLLPASGLAATIVWNPIEDRYDAQLATTVLIGPQGCFAGKVVKNITYDRVEAVYVCEQADTPELFVGLYPVDDFPRIVGGGGDGPTGGFGPTGGVTPTLIRSPTGGISLFPPTGGLAPIGTDDPTETVTHLMPTGGTKTAPVPEIMPIVSVGTQNEEGPFESYLGTTTNVDAPAIVPIPAPFATLMLGLGCLLGLRRRRQLNTASA